MGLYIYFKKKDEKIYFIYLFFQNNNVMLFY